MWIHLPSLSAHTGLLFFVNGDLLCYDGRMDEWEGGRRGGGGGSDGRMNGRDGGARVAREGGRDGGYVTLRFRSASRELVCL